VTQEVEIAIISSAAGILGAVVGGVIGFAAAWWAASSTNKVQTQIAEGNVAFQKQLAVDVARSQRREALETMILKLTEFAIEHPTFEKDSYCSAYPKCPGDENGRERYENYCTYVFNVVNAVWNFCDRDPQKVKEFLHVEELIKRHWRCWKKDDGNLGYEQDYLNYINVMIDELRRRKEIT
jgi:hypothetical protein